MVLLASQADLEKYGHVNVTAEPDASITARLESASAIIESYCNRIFASETVTGEIHDGGSKSIFLRRPPITSVTTVVENGVTLAAADYAIYAQEGRLLRLSGGWPYQWYWKPRGVVVTYVGGYVTIPFDVRLVCVRIAERAFKAAAAWSEAPTGAGAVKSITLAGSDSVTYADSVTQGVAAVASPLTDEDRAVLDPYRLVSIT